nr:hypothetical protein [Treponema sp.]
WPVDYEIKYNRLDEANIILWDFIIENPEYQVYTVNWKAYSIDNDFKDEYLQLCLYYEEQVPFGIILKGNIFLKDVNAKVSFNIHPVDKPPYGTVYLVLGGYSKDIEKNKDKIITKKGCEWHSFNDVEPTEEETKIKESFEKNFLAKLPLETEYVDPGNLDKNLSKILRFLKKWKIKYIFIIGIIVLIIRIIYVICRNIENKVEERKFFKKAIENRKKLEEE